MDFSWQTLLLGAVQGVTEFLPVSSSGHLALLQVLFDFSAGADPLAFDLLLHCATLLAVLIFFRKDVILILSQWLGGFFSFSSLSFFPPEARRSEGWRYGWLILAATGVTSLIALPLKGAVEAALSSLPAVGGGFFVTGGLLCLVPLALKRQAGLREKNISENISLKAALAVGLVQGLAVFPGVSRSGSTLAAALLMGVAAPEAFRFSFLMSVPVILGASLLEALPLRQGAAVLPEGWLPAAAAAFLLGYASLLWLRRLVLSGRWFRFGLYCFFMSLLAAVIALSGAAAPQIP